MNRSRFMLLIYTFSFHLMAAQDYGDFPTIQKEKLLNDLEILYQGLDKLHSGMYWYTPKDSVDLAFQAVRNKITRDLNVLEFYKHIAPLVGLSREDHTDVYLPKSISARINSETKFMPMTVVFLGRQLYCVKNGAELPDVALEGKQIESINGETPVAIVEKIGSLFASDGYIKPVKYSDLEGFDFSLYYFYYYGQIDEYTIRFKGIEKPLKIKALGLPALREQLKKRYPRKNPAKNKDLLEYTILQDSIAYLGIHSFSNPDIKALSKEKNFKIFLQNSFKSIQEKDLNTLVIDVSKNTGGSEGNEGLLYSYLGKNYKKYKKVKAKTQKAILDNGVDKPIKLKTFGWLERLFTVVKKEDGSLERKASIGKGLMAYKKEPDYKFAGKIYVIISPVTYSGGSEFSNMVYTRDLATFVGQETGGGYWGNTSGYSKELVLPNSKIRVYIPVLQFIMNVAPKLPFGSGVRPHHEVIPSFEQYVKGENAALKYIVEELEKR